MKKSLSFLLLFGLASTSYAQSVKTTKNNGTIANTSSAGIGANNPWFGGQIGYKFAGSDDFSDNLLVSARLLNEIKLSKTDTRFHLPVMGNISQIKDNLNNTNLSDDEKKSGISSLLMSTSGVNVGLYPYYEITRDDFFSITLHGVIAYKLNSFDLGNDNVQYLNQGRFSVGLETSIGETSAKTGRNPLTLSIAPTVTVFDKNIYNTVFKESRSNLNSLEITGVLPVGRGFGLLVESIIAKSTSFRAGILISTELSK